MALSPLGQRFLCRRIKSTKSRTIISKNVIRLHRPLLTKVFMEKIKFCNFSFFFFFLKFSIDLFRFSRRHRKARGKRVFFFFSVSWVLLDNWSPRPRQRCDACTRNRDAMHTIVLLPWVKSIFVYKSILLCVEYKYKCICTILLKV